MSPDVLLVLVPSLRHSTVDRSTSGLRDYDCPTTDAAAMFPSEIEAITVTVSILDFDHSSCHNTLYADNALISSNMNANLGSKQNVLRDTVWEGEVQNMVTKSGVPKGLIQV